MQSVPIILFLLKSGAYCTIPTVVLMPAYIYTYVMPTVVLMAAYTVKEV